MKHTNGKGDTPRKISVPPTVWGRRCTRCGIPSNPDLGMVPRRKWVMVNGKLKEIKCTK